MIIENGYITVIGNAPASFDDDGNPVIGGSVKEGGAIACNWQTAQRDKEGRYIDGKFEQSSFVVMIDLQPFFGERIRIYDDQKKFVAECLVQDAQRLTHVDTLKILCQ